MRGKIRDTTNISTTSIFIIDILHILILIISLGILYTYLDSIFIGCK